MEALCIVNYTYHNDSNESVYRVVSGRVVMVEDLDYEVHRFFTSSTEMNSVWYLSKHEVVILNEVVE